MWLVVCLRKQQKIIHLKLEWFVNCYLMRIEATIKFLQRSKRNTITKIKLNALREQCCILRELIDTDEVSEGTALKLREAINYDEMVIVDSMT